MYSRASNEDTFNYQIHGNEAVNSYVGYNVIPFNHEHGSEFRR